MDIEGSWKRIINHRKRLTEKELQGLAEVLFRDREDWLADRLWVKGEETLALAFLGYLGKRASIKAVNLLIAQLECRDEVLQMAAAESLKECPPEMVSEPMVQIMRRQNQASAKAGEILLSFGAPGREALWRLWFEKDETVTMKTQIMTLLAETKEERAQALAFLAFLSGSDDLIKAALSCAEMMEAKALWGNVAECLKNPNWRIRGKAAQLLGAWGHKEALPYLLQMQTDPDPWVEEERQRALARLS